MALQRRRWETAYFRSQVANHPELTVAQNRFGWYLMDYSKAKNPSDWNDQLRTVEEFPRTADEPPKPWEYLPLIYYVLGGAVLPWLLVHALAWIVDGFRIGSGTQV
jgi:hypothetical protein